MKSQRLGLLRLYRNLDKILLLFFTVFASVFKICVKSSAVP